MKPARFYNQQRAYGKLLFVILFIGGLYSSILINNISYESFEVISDSIFPIIPQTADSFEDGDSINSTHVYLYLDGVKQSGIPDLKRGIETLNITFNNTKHLENTAIYDENIYGEGYFFANITLNGGFEFNLSLAAVPNETRLWTTSFTPSIVNSTGIATIAIMVFNTTSGVLINNPHFTDRRVNIINNLPQLGVSMNGTEIYRGNFLKLNFTPSDIEDSVFDLQWQVTLYKNGTSNVNQTIADFNDVNKIYGYVLEIETTFLVGNWYINATCIDKDNAKNSLIYNFEVLNNFPVIESVEFFVNGVSKSSNIEVRRITDVLIVNVTVNELENKNNMLMSFQAKDPISGANILIPLSNYVDFGPTDISNGIFTKNLTFPGSMACGYINFIITVFESGTPNEKDEFTQVIKIINNPVEILNFSINGQSGQSLSFTVNQELNFTSKLYDVENRIQYIQVVLYHEDGKKTIEYVIPYNNGNDTSLMIRAVDIPSGDYMIYLIAIDDNGDKTQSIAIAVNIYIEETIDPFVWLLFAVGIIIGITFSIGLIYWRNRMKQSTSNSEKDIVSEKKVIESQERKNKNVSIDTNANSKQQTESISQKKKKSNPDIEEEQNLTEKPKKKLIRKL